MADSLVESGLTYFADPEVGRPISDGYVYIGKTDLDPELEVNQIPVFLALSDGSLVSVSQPLRTSKGGTINYNNSTAQIVVEGDYSIKVLDGAKGFVYYVPRNSGSTGGESGREFSQTIDDGTGATVQTVVLGLIDENKYRRYGGSGEMIYQIPNDAAIGWEDNTQIYFHLYADIGKMSVEIGVGSGVTLNSPSSGSSINAAGDGMLLKKVGVDTWDMQATKDSDGSSTLSLINGTQLNPSLRFIASMDTGLFSTAPGNMAFTSEGAEKVRFSGSGLAIDKGAGFQEVATTVEVSLKANTASPFFTGDIAVTNVSAIDTDVSARNGTNGITLRAGNESVSLWKTDSAGNVDENPILLQDSVATNFYSEGSADPQLFIDGVHSQKVRRAFQDRLIAAEFTTPTFDGAIFINDVDIDIPGTLTSVFKMRNDEVGLALTSHISSSKLSRTSGAGVIAAGPLVSQSTTSTNLYYPGSNDVELTIDAPESQKVLRGGVSEMIATQTDLSEAIDAANGLPTSGGTMTGDTINDGVKTIYRNLTNAALRSSIYPSNLAGARFLTMCGGDSSTDGAQTVLFGTNDGSFPGHIRMKFGGAASEALTIESEKVVKAWNLGGTLFNQIATLDDLSGSGDGLPLTGGTLTGSLTMDLQPIYMKASGGLLGSIRALGGGSNQGVAILGGDTDGAKVEVSGPDGQLPNAIEMYYGGAGFPSLTIASSTEVLAWSEFGDSYNQVATLYDLANLPALGLPTTGGTMTGDIVMDGGNIVIENPSSSKSGTIAPFGGVSGEGIIITGGTANGGRLILNGSTDAVPNRASLKFGGVQLVALEVYGEKQARTWNQDGSVFSDIATMNDLATGLASSSYVVSLTGFSSNTVLAATDFQSGKIITSNDGDLTIPVDDSGLLAMPAGTRCTVITLTTSLAPITVVTSGGGTLIKLMGDGALHTETAVLTTYGEYIITKINSNTYTIAGVGMI